MKSTIEGVVVYPINKHEDDRGWLAELFRHDCLEVFNFPAMAYVSMTKPGVTRGPHEHKNQTDLFAFLGPGTFELYLWGHGKKEVWGLGENRPAAVIVPPGVVHAYRNVSWVDGWVFNAPNRLYGGPGKLYPVDEIRHEEATDGEYHIPAGCTGCNGPDMCNEEEKARMSCCPWNPIPDIDPEKEPWYPKDHTGRRILHSSSGRGNYCS
jgi:dTDP-4-dehydrorhamnose 3,5-epimerase